MHIVFDLDDTLYPEADYAHSALRCFAETAAALYGTPVVAEDLIAGFEAGEKDAVGKACRQAGLADAARGELLALMRAHRPAITLPPDSREALARLAARTLPYSILTDGRSLTQRQKIHALGLAGYAGLFISAETGREKPDPRAYLAVAALHSAGECFVYIGDNPAKDFFAPNALGWQTVMIRDRGRNIHPQTPVPSRLHAAGHVADTLCDALSLIGFK